MSIDYGAMERQFLETLKADSGRSIEEWMSAIAAQGLTRRNDIIDWLRREGFMFSKASWIERIHNNGGRPIYGDAGTARPSPRAPTRPRIAVPARPTPAPAPSAIATPAPSSVPPPPAPAPGAGPGPDAGALDAVLVRAKAYRPLAAYVIAEVRKAVPATDLRLVENAIVFTANARPFASLAVSAKDVRLALALASAPPGGVPLEPVRPALRGTLATSHMIVLTDARQVTPELMAVVAQAAAGA